MNHSQIKGQSTAIKVQESALAQKSTEAVASSPANFCPEEMKDVGRTLAVPVLQGESQSTSPDALPVISRGRDGKIIFFDRNTPLHYRLKPGMMVSVEIIRDFPNYSIARPLKMEQSIHQSDDALNSRTTKKQSPVHLFEVSITVLGQKTDLATAHKIFDEMALFFGDEANEYSTSVPERDETRDEQDELRSEFVASAELRRAGMLGTERAGQW